MDCSAPHHTPIPLPHHHHALQSPPYGVPDSAPIAAAEMLLSELADTLVLPYTIYQQNELGVIPVTRKQR